MRGLGSLLPMGVLTDSYKATHFLQYPPCQQMMAVSRILKGLHSTFLLLLQVGFSLVFACPGHWPIPSAYLDHLVWFSCSTESSDAAMVGTKRTLG